MSDSVAMPDRRFQFRITDPEKFGGLLETVAPNVSARSGSNGQFSADVQAVTLPNLGLFAVRIENAMVVREPSEYIAITVPLDYELRFFGGEDVTGFLPGSAHILWADTRMDLEIPRASTLLVATYPTAWLRMLWGAETVTRFAALSSRGEAISLESPAGRTYWRNLNYLWSEVCRGAVFLDSEMAAHEIEKSNAALFLLAIEGDKVGSANDIMRAKPDPILERVEGYIRDHLTEDFSLADLVTAAECSASTLLRTFRLHRSTTPMQYAKQLRLETVQRMLLAAEPDSGMVSETAMEYGFFQLGRFSSDYKRAFGELPSETLAR